jgi:hypothetical protein
MASAWFLPVGSTSTYEQARRLLKRLIIGQQVGQSSSKILRSFPPMNQANYRPCDVRLVIGSLKKV